MPEESKENKAKKLAAARKKLKEYQAKEKRESNGNNTDQVITSDLKNDANLTAEIEKTENESHSALDNSMLESEHPTVVERPTVECPMVEEIANQQAPLQIPNSSSSIDTIQILITEKAALSSELNKFRNILREKNLENEELQTRLQLTSKRFTDLQNEFSNENKMINELKSKNLTLQVQLEETKSKFDDQSEHLEEVKKLLSFEKDKTQTLQNELKDVTNELEFAKIKINQLSDEASITKDSRVETLTQTQFMYEQQIRDLQAMVQQLTSDKEHANQQYQTYVQHLNSEVNNLNEKNTEIAEECSKLQERERQFVEHISSLEKEIQKSISRQDQLKDNQEFEANKNFMKEIDDLKAKIAECESERYEFELKVKSQEDRFEIMNQNIIEKDNKILELEEQIQNILSDRPDSVKLLATMESDKIAASRALTQNDALKKQLDELEFKFVQLTNDKADLVNKLDAEEYVNREIRNSFTNMEEQIKSLDEKLHFKDEEMIRLSHENNDLTKQNLILQQQLDRLQHYKARDFSKKYQNSQERPKENENDEHDQGHDSHHHNHDDHHNSNDNEKCDGLNPEPHLKCSTSLADCDQFNSQANCDDQNQTICSSTEYSCIDSSYRCDDPPTIPTIEALQKLQNRFTKLMAQVADLTDEKQRLEHLVLQLQGETETIGEYITLYQTQRRILKQREYEKASQLQLLLGEREEMREKITTLNKLVSNLGVELPNNLRLNENFTKAMENVCIEPTMSSSTDNYSEQDKHEEFLDESIMNKRLNSNESKETLTKIQNIISEIKENTKDMPPVNTADHLTCCSGKFEIV